MSARRPHVPHFLPITGDRYSACLMPGCRRVRRAYWAKPIIHNGRKPRR